MLAGLGSRSVEFLPLGDIAQLVRGNGMPKSELTTEGVGAIHYGQIYTRYDVWTTSTISFVEPETAARLVKVEPGDVVITNTSENLEDVGKAVAWLGAAPIVTGGHATVIRHRQDPKYLAYWFQSESFFAQKRALATGTKVIDVSARQLAKVVVPLPPLEVQAEIVRVLDRFAALQTELQTEIQAEIEARHREYAHYRDSLLLASKEAPILKLGDIAEFKYGLTASAQDSGDYRFLRITDINSRGKLAQDRAKYVPASPAARDFLVEPGDLLMARTGATFGKTMLFVGDQPSAYASFLIRIRFKEPNLLPAYYWHFAQSDLYWKQANAMVSTGGQPQFNANALKRIEVPMPPVPVQRRAVSLLDRFDDLTSDLTSCLSAEVRSRRQQYKYHREQLLSFQQVVS